MRPVVTVRAEGKTMGKPTAKRPLRAKATVLGGLEPRRSLPRSPDWREMLSVTAVGLVMAQPAVAALSCPSVDTNPSNSTTCTISSSQGGSGAQVSVVNTASAGTGDNIGGYGGNYTVVNNGAVLQPSVPQGGIFVRRGDQISEEDRVLLEAGARGIVSDGKGTLAE